MLLKFCTRESIIKFFLDEIKDKTTFEFGDEDVEVIMNELDPYHTGVIQINLI